VSEAGSERTEATKAEVSVRRRGTGDPEATFGPELKQACPPQA
jgi:hypothetical protein